MTHPSPLSPLPSKKPLWPTFVKIGILVLCCIILLLAIIPMVLSSSYGAKKISSYLSERTSAKVSIDKISLQWFGSQVVSGIHYEDLKHQMSATVELIQTDSSLFHFLFHPSHIGELKILKPSVVLQKQTGPVLSLKSPQIHKASLLYLPALDPFFTKDLFAVTGLITITDGSIEVMTSDTSKVTFSKIGSTCFIARDKSQMTLTLNALSSDEQRQGTILFEGFLRDVSTDSPSFTSKTTLSSFPVNGLDQIVTLLAPQYKGLLVDTIGPTLDVAAAAELSKSILQLKFTMNSDNVKASLYTKKESNAITLTAPASLSLTLSPKTVAQLFKQLYPQVNVSLQNQTQLQISLDSFSLPLLGTQLNLSDLAFSSSISLTPFQLTLPQAQALSINPLKLNLKSDSIAKGVSFTLQSAIGSQDKAPAQLALEGQITDLIDGEPKLISTLKMQDVPSSLLDAFASSSTPSALLGDKLSLIGSFNFSSETAKATLAVSTPTLTVTEIKMQSSSNGFALQEPFDVTLSPTQKLYDAFFGNEVVQAPSEPVKLNVASLNLPSLSSFQKLECSATLSAPLLTYQKLFTMAPYTLKNLLSSISIDTLDHIHIDTQSSLLSFTLDAALDPATSKLEIKKPLQISYLLTDDQLSSFLPQEKRAHLTNPAQFNIVLSPMKLQMDKLSLSSLELKGTIAAKAITFLDPNTSTQSSLTGSQADFSYSGPKNTLEAKVASSFSQNNTPMGSLKMDLQLSQFLQGNKISLPSAKSRSQIDISQLSTSLIQTLLSSSSLDPILGSTLDLKVDWLGSASMQTISLHAKSPLCSFDGSLLYNGNLLQISGSPLKAKLTLTKEGYPVIDHLLSKDGAAKSPFSLVDTADFTFELSSFSIPFITDEKTKSYHPDLAKAIFSGKLQNNALSFVEESTSQTIAIEQFTTTFSKTQSSSPLKLSLSAKANSSSQKSSSSVAVGTVSIDAVLDQFIAPSGAIDLSHLSSDFNVDIQKFPSSVLDLFARTAGKTNAPFSALFGPQINMTMKTHLQDATGPITLNINSANTRASMAGSLTNGILTLSEPIYAQVTMSPELSTLLLKEVNPLSMTEISSKHPFTLEIDPKGFSLPISPFKLEEMNVPNARIELGQVSCKNEGNLTIALGLLKMSQNSQGNTLNLWFTPVDLHILQGVVKVERTDILVADAYDIALWGTVNPVSDKVDMVLGLTAQALKKAFKIKNLPEDYVLHIPLKGSLEHVEINKTAATAKIAALLAWQQKSLAGAIGGGPAGALFGEFLNKIGTLPLNDESTPPPKKPFPWDKSSSDANEDRPHGKKMHVKGKQKPLKQLIKIIR